MLNVPHGSKFDNDMLKALASGGFGAAQRLSGLGVQGEGAAYTGPKFLHQMEEAALAALAGAAHASGTSVDQKALAGDKARAMDDLNVEIANCTNPAVRVRLTVALERLMVAKTPDAIRAAIAAAAGSYCLCFARWIWLRLSLLRFGSLEFFLEKFVE